MDQSSSLQDVTRCDLCKTNVVYNYCEVCHTKLCGSCIDDHISNEDFDHDIVLYSRRNSLLRYPKCGTHQHKISEFQCKDCNVLLCSSCKEHKKHEGHMFVEITNVYKTKKKIIEQDKKDLKVISPKYENLLFDVKNKMLNIDKDYEYLAKDISKRGEDLHQEIDIVINEMKHECKKMKNEHKYILQTQLNEIKRKWSCIKQAIQSLNIIEQTNEVSELIEYDSKVREFCNLPPEVTISMPSFINESVDRMKLRSFFGYIIPLSSDTEKNVLMLKSPNSLYRELLDKPALLATIQTDYKDLFSVACVDGEQIWTSGRSNDIKCYDTKGVPLKTIKTKLTSYPIDLALCRNGDLLYSDSGENTVNRVTNDQTKVFITLKGWVPRNLCVTISGDVLVAMHSEEIVQSNSPKLNVHGDYGIQSKIIRYSERNEIQTIQYDKEGKPLYSATVNIKFISENKNLDICVSDSDAGAVVVVNKAGELRWRYTGNHQYSSKDSFQPFGISTDSQSRILLAEYTNQCIHILDQDGRFLQNIDNFPLSTPYGLCVDCYDDLFVCAHQIGNILKIKYSIPTTTCIYDRRVAIQ